MTTSDKWFKEAVLNSYSQIFFSNNKLFAILLLVVTFIDYTAGFVGLFSVVITNFFAYHIGLNKFNIKQGYYGFNALLVALGLATLYHMGGTLVILIILSSILSLFVSVVLDGLISKYYLPQLSLPFILVLWMFILSSREFYSLGLNERGVYQLNELYSIGGGVLVDIYNWINGLNLSVWLKSYFLSLSSILFQYNILGGFLIAIGLLIYSRIAFSLSLLGFLIVSFFYYIIGYEINSLSYNYSGFNYILTSIALGGFFIIPNRSSYLSLFYIIPLVAIFSVSTNVLLQNYQLSVYSLPFNFTVLMFLYVLKFRINNKIKLFTIFYQYNNPEKNLYAFRNNLKRFGNESPFPIYLPFHGEWVVTQGHNGEYTHTNEWLHAWDFEIKDELGKTFKNSGDIPDDYYCFDKNIIAPADGIVQEVLDGIADNTIGEKDLENNWGNTIVIKITEYLYVNLSHLKKDSIKIKVGDVVRKGDVLARCGNSGNSPYPHLHFQIQATPYIGSRTIDYPISNCYIRRGNLVDLYSVVTPKEHDILTNIATNEMLKNAFQMVVGKQITFEVDGNADNKVVWEVKVDYSLNKYIECEKTQSKAYFKLNDSIFYFTHFEGDRRSLLYYFYLAAYKVSLGVHKDVVVKDEYPVNMVFSNLQLFVQDFIAPFYMFLNGQFSLNYIGNTNLLSNNDMKLNGTMQRTVFNKNISKIKLSISIDNKGIKRFYVENNQNKIEAVCTSN